jgi:polar amino acid transport system substrate-binding protein
VIRGKAAAIVLAVLSSVVFNAAAEELTAVAEPWPPYMEPGLPGQGFLADLARRCLGTPERRVRVEFYPWARAFEAVKEGKADILMGAYRSAERDAWFQFTNPVAVSTDSLFALRRTGAAQFRSLRDLSPYLIGVVRGAVHGEEFDGAAYLKKEASDSNIRNIEKLIAGRVHLIAGPSDVVRHYIANRFPEHADSIVELTPALNKSSMHFAVSRRRGDAADLCRTMDAAIARMKADGSLAALAKRHGISP